MRATPVHPEGGRYAAPLVFLPGLWTPARSCAPLAAYLAHRGWAGWLVDLADVRGGIAARADAVAAHLATLPGTPVLVGHDAGALVVLGVARRTATTACVLVSPLVPEAPLVRLVWRRDALVALLRGRPVPPPPASRAADLWGDAPAAGLQPEAAEVVLDVVRRRVPAPAPPAPTPALCIAGAGDPLLPPAAARAFAARIGADHREVAAGGHWPHLGPRARALGDVVHRWLVTALGEAVLEGYADAMAERDGDDEG
jgi:pimeloyl-ACP methyl ester carboxylesterase